MMWIHVQTNYLTRLNMDVLIQHLWANVQLFNAEASLEKGLRLRSDRPQGPIKG